jgi:hypothetical protein
VHSADKFKRDLVESTLVTIGSPANKVSFALPSLFRDFSFVMVTDANGAPYYDEDQSIAQNCELHELQDINERPARIKRTIVGTNCQVYNPAGNITYLLYGYYAFPDVSSMSNSTWITNNAAGEQAIVDGAMYYVKQKLGDTEGMRVEQQFWHMWLSTVISINVLI